jgi:hypothetical protein
MGGRSANETLGYGMEETPASGSGAAPVDPNELLGVSVHVVCELRAGAELAPRC